MKRRSNGEPRARARGARSRRGCLAAWLIAVLASVPAQAQDAKNKPLEGKTEPIPAGGNTIVVEGDTMWDLSGRYLGSPYEWPRLWSYNPEVTNPHWIYPGYVMRLREDAQGGTSVEPPPGMRDGAPGAMAKTARFGGGFGSRARGRRDGAIVIGDVVFLDKKALERSGKIVGSSEDHMMLSPFDEVYVKFKKGVAPTQGREMTIYQHALRREVSPQAGPIEVIRDDEDTDGEIVRVLGALRVESFDEENRIARAVITEALDPIERGFDVTDVPRRLAEVPPRTNQKKVEGKVLAATRALGTLGHNQLVFIGAGEEAGVQVGNRFLVLRRGDTWRKQLTLKEVDTGAERPSTNPPDNDKYPWEPIAEIRVLYVRPDTSTGIITNSASEVSIGDRVEMREGY